MRTLDVHDLTYHHLMHGQLSPLEQKIY